MLIFPLGVKILLALGHTDMRKGFDSLAVLVQAELVVLRSLPRNSVVKSRCESSGRSVWLVAAMREMRWRIADD